MMRWLAILALALPLQAQDTAPATIVPFVEAAIDSAKQLGYAHTYPRLRAGVEYDADQMLSVNRFTVSPSAYNMQGFTVTVAAAAHVHYHCEIVQ